MYYIALQILVPVIFLIYGARLRFKTPPFGQTNRGFSTWRTRESPEEWKAGNRYCGLLCMIYGGFFTVVTAIKFIVYGPVEIMVYNYAYAIIALIFMLTLVPIVHHMLTKQFGEGSDSYYNRLR